MSQTLELTPELRNAWARNGIVSRFFVDLDTCEEIVTGLPELVFVQVRVSEHRWELSAVRKAETKSSPSAKKTSQRQQRYAQYE